MIPVEIKSVSVSRWCGECEAETGHAVWTDGSTECRACGFFARMVPDRPRPTLPQEDFGREDRLRRGMAMLRSVRSPILWRARKRLPVARAGAWAIVWGVWGFIVVAGVFGLLAVLGWRP